MATISKVPFLLSLAILSGCGISSSDKVSSGEAKNIARHYINMKLPQMDISHMKSSAVNEDALWVVKYEAVSSGSGGLFVVKLNENTGEVVDFQGEQ